jgi:hypothetical protein
LQTENELTRLYSYLFKFRFQIFIFFTVIRLEFIYIFASI